MDEPSDVDDSWVEPDDFPGQLAVDVYETADKLIIKARTAGISKSDLDVSISDAFNLFIYIAICIGGTGVINSALSRIKLSRLKAEVKNTGWVLLAINGTCLSAMVMFMLRAYHLGDASATAPLLASSVVVNVIVSFFVAKERDNIPKKILCACVILASVVLITFAK